MIRLGPPEDTASSSGPKLGSSPSDREKGFRAEEPLKTAFLLLDLSRILSQTYHPPSVSPFAH